MPTPQQPDIAQVTSRLASNNTKVMNSLESMVGATANSNRGKSSPNTTLQKQTTGKAKNSSATREERTPKSK